MSLHRVDPRFALPHRVKTAIVLDGLGEWRTGLSSAGIEVLDELRRRGPAPDLVVSTARNADAARRMQPTSVIVEAAHTGPFRGDEYRIEQLLLRPTRERPTLALPLDQPAPISYALERWSVVDRRWKATRMRIARGLISHGLFPPWASPVVTVATRAPGPPRLVAAASAHGVANDARWFLTLGQGDALSRNAFQLFRADADEPDWLLKFARVPDDAKRFDNDERGLRLAHAAGAIAAARVPRLLGRFEVDGVHASLETAAAGSRLRDILRTPAERGVKLELIAGIAEWILEWGRLTRTSSNGLGAELRRLRDEVVPRWAQFGATRALVDELTSLPAVSQHNDLGSWNVVARRGGDFVVVDWENATAAGLPLWDLFYFLADALVLLDDPNAIHDPPERLPERIVRLFAGTAPSSPQLFAWVRDAADGAGLSSRAVGAIATLCWLSHSLSADAHNLDLAALTPNDPPRLHGLEGMAQAWMAHPALGPGWSTWREG